MSEIVACPSCGKRNRVPAATAGKPACAACGAALPWVVPAGDDDFEAAASTGMPVLVDLWAPWCGPCRAVAPVLQQLATERAGHLKVVKVNVDEAPRLSARFGAQSIPTLVLLRDGQVVDRVVGARPAHELSRWLDAHP